MMEAGWSARRVAHQLDRSDCVVAPSLGAPVSSRTIRRHLAEGHLGSRRPLSVLPLTPTHRRLRLVWCRARGNWTAAEWNQVVFSEKSGFNLSSDDNRVRLWRPRGERLNPAFALQRHTASSAGVMVWGAIADNTWSPIVMIRDTMTAQRSEVILIMDERKLDQTPQDINKEEFPVEGVRLQAFEVTTEPGFKKELMSGVTENNWAPRKVIYEYHAKKIACLLRQTIRRAVFQLLRNCCSATLRACTPLIRRDDIQRVPGLESTASAEGCPIQAISRCLSLVLLCEMAHYHEAKSLCHVFWPIPIVFRSKRGLTGLQEFIIHNTTLAPPDIKHGLVAEISKAEWHQVVFSNESRFNLWDHDGRIRVRRYAGERCLPECVIERHNALTPGVMVWGMISYHGRFHSLRIEGSPGAIFQQDNARPLVTKTVRDFCSAQHMQLPPWPTYSPDISSIEHVWVWLVGVYPRDPRPAASKDELLLRIQAIWNSLPQADIQNPFDSMPRRIAALISAHGSYAKY
ncbi:transposable element Tc1 transposase [Trichonephila clavipes]|nr:transposable element Tc1 transposase [Trichonephila clavipes]